MATLEVHDPRGGVERLVVSRDQTTLIGSSPKCEVVLGGEGVFPIHARLRWNPAKQKFKVDASPDAQFLLVNGTRMASASFRMGDEIEVAGFRIFLLNDGPSPGEEYDAPARDEPTRVQPPPFLAPATPIPPPRRETPAPRSKRPESRPKPAFEDDLDALVMELDADEPQEEVVVDRSLLEKARPQPGSPPLTGPTERGFAARWFDRLRRRGGAPGEEAILSSPLVVTLVASFALLVVVGIGLYQIIVRTAATRLYNQAVENLEDGDYRNALRRFDDFLAANPKDVRAGPARVHRAMAEVRQYTAGAGASWELALEAERAMLERVGKEPSFRDSSTELAELVLRTGENLADRARSSADAKTLATAESTVELHARVAGASAETFLKRSRLPTRLDAARAAVEKAAVRRHALAAMDVALKEGSSAGVYAARDGLVARYADFAADRELLRRMTAANDLIRKAVTLDPSRFPAETAPHDEPLGPPTTFVLRSPPEGDRSAVARPAASVFAVADGMAYGVDGATGEPVWQRPVGLSSPFPPQPVPGGTTAIGFDARHNELVRLDAATGRLVWRQALGEPIADPPLVLGNQVIQATPGGRLVFLALESGELQAALTLGLPLSGTPVSDESGQVLYVTARKDCLFVLTRDPLACAGVIYLGHAAGAIACPPARVGRYLVVPENHEFDAGRWRIFLLGEDSLTLAPVQEVPVRGWTWATPASYGSVLWSVGDRGGVAAWAIGGYTEKEPFRLIARINPTEIPTGPAFALARSERELWVGSARSARVDLNPESSTLTESWSLPDAGPAVAPPQVVGPLLVLRQQQNDGPGVGLWGVDPQRGRVVWRTVLGAPWPSPPRPDREGGALSVIANDGSRLRITRESLARGGFVTAPLPRPAGLRLPAESSLVRLDGPGWEAIAGGAGSSSLLVRGGDEAEFREVRLPAPLAASPLAWHGQLFVPGADGRAYLIDPRTGISRAEPFVPPFDRNKPLRWRSAAALGDDALALADDLGRVRRMALVTDPRPRIVVTAEATLGQPLIADPASTASAFVAVTADNRIRALAARDLSPIGAWPLDAPLALPPAAVVGRVFLSDVTGGLTMLQPDGQRAWTVTLAGGSGLAGAPAVRDDSAWVVTRDGHLLALSLADGSTRLRRPLRLLPAGGVATLGDQPLVPVGRSTLRPLLTDRVAPDEPTTDGGREPGPRRNP